MKNRTVNIITGNEMNLLSNQTFELDVHPMCDHSYILSEFIEVHKIKYPYIDLSFSHDIIKMAALSNIVIFKSYNFLLMSLPDEITEYQLRKLEEYKPFITGQKSILCLMNVIKDNEKLSFKEYNSYTSPEIYESLVNEKYNRWKKNQEIKTKYKDYHHP